MLTIVKRSGKEEAFNIDKIKNSAAAASDELRQPLNSGDILNLAADVEKRLKGKKKITSRELYEIVVDTMRSGGFIELADVYASYNSASFRSGPKT